MIIAGLEEAGKGPGIGPLAVCCLSIDEHREVELKMIGVKDSKMLTPLKRTFLAEKIKEVAHACELAVVEPEEIDESVNQNNLNKLEADKMAELIDKIKPDVVYIDCPSPNKESFANYIKSKIKIKKKIKIITEHKADIKYPIVSAASIIAKVTRDNEVEKIKKEYNIDFGSGYMSDPLSQKFLEENWEKPEYRKIIRQSWESWKRLKRNKGQKKLGEW